MNNTDKRRRLVPIREALPYIGCGLTICYELINSGQIIGVKLGGRTMVDLDSVDAYHKALPRIGAQG
jgi:hypothetical protein